MVLDETKSSLSTVSLDNILRDERYNEFNSFNGTKRFAKVDKTNLMKVVPCKSLTNRWIFLENVYSCSL